MLFLYFFCQIFEEKDAGYKNRKKLENQFCRRVRKFRTKQKTHLFHPLLSHLNSVSGNFGIVGKRRECRIQIYPERTLLELL